MQHDRNQRNWRLSNYIQRIRTDICPYTVKKLQKMMKLLCLCLMTVSGLCWSQTPQPEMVRTAHLTLNQMPPYLFFLELLPYQARGELKLFQDHLEYSAKSCFPAGFNQLARIEMFPCCNHLIKDIHINYGEIKKIRRGYRLAILVPNMLVIKDQNDNKYRFMVWGRGKIVKYIKQQMGASKGS